MDRRLIAVFAAGLLLGGGAAAWAFLQMKAPDKPVASLQKPSEAVKVSATAGKAAAAPVAAYSHVACPATPLIAAASRDDGMMRLKSEPDTPAGISALILTGKESAAAGRPRDAELTFLAACKAADQLQRADASEPTDARYQLARHYAHYVLVGNAPSASRAELVRRAELLYTDSIQAYRARNGAEHEKTRFASEGLAALRQSQTLAQAAPVKPAAAAAVRPVPQPRGAPAPVPVQVAEPKPARPAAAPTAAVAPAPPVVAQAPRPRRVARVPAPEDEPEVIEAPVRQATGTSSRGDRDTR